MASNSLRVLLVDDSGDAALTRRALDACTNPSFLVDEATSLPDAAEQLQASSYHVVLLVLGMNESAGIERVTQYGACCADPPPLIVLTSLDDEEAALQMLDRGVQDYLVKSDVRPHTLSRSIRYALQRHQMLGQLHAANELLRSKNERLGELYDTAQQFVDNVSHEFRTPLTVIREFTSIVRDGCDGPVTPKQCEHLDKVLHRTDDLALMVDDMLDISKLEAGLLGVWRRPCQLADLVANVTTLLKKRADSKAIRLTSQLPPDLCKVFCDEEKAQRVLINLTVNAIKFTPDRGHVEIWARADQLDAEVTVGVTDSGPGISPEKLELVFERFRQLETNLRASTKGFGLGLNIAKELVSLNLGQMHVESQVGKGSTFSFTLPANDPIAVFARYAKQLRALPEAPVALSFLAASIDTDSDERVDCMIDEYLQRSVRVRDLVIQAATHTWVVAAACAEQDVPGMIERLDEGWQEYARNCPRGQLPELHIRHHSTHAFSSGLEPMTEKFHRLFESRPPKCTAGGTVLVVDDDQEVNSCLGVRLQAAGYDVLSAYDGEQGFAAAIEHRPVAVVLDLRMPNMDGLTMLHKMRSHQGVAQTPVVVLSANIRDQHRALEAGANYFVAKPYEATTVLSAIESSLGERSLA